MATSSDSPTQPEKRRSSIRPPWSLWVVIAAVVLGNVLLFTLLRSARPFPEIADIRGMEANFFFADTGFSPVTFAVPPAHWGKILSALLPARKDANPAKWAICGHLQLNLANGNSFEITLFRLGDKPGAFAAGPNWEERVYYRGGNEADLEKALDDAFKASERAKPGATP